jgi:hypothetical protein
VTDLQKAARTVATAKLIADVVKGEGDRARAEIDAAMAELGVERLRVADGDGGDAGTLSRTAGRTSARVTDEAAFERWVAERHPDQMVLSVRPGFRERLLFAAANAGAPVDSDLSVIPGVEVVTGEPYVSFRASAGAKSRMRDLLASSGLLALTDGRESNGGAS